MSLINRDQQQWAVRREDVYKRQVYVGRVIQQASGETFKQYVNRLKMEEAKQLLSSSDQLVYEIAEELGFKDSKYFISRFTEETGRCV